MSNEFYKNSDFTTGVKWTDSSATYNTTDITRAKAKLDASGYGYDAAYGVKPIDATIVGAAFTEVTKYINFTASNVAYAQSPNITVSLVKNLTHNGEILGGVKLGAVNTDIAIAIDSDDAGNMQPGSYGFELLMHEISHALGLYTNGEKDHPHEIAPRSNYTRDNTIMSYEKGIAVDFSPNAITPAMYDIAALQSLYGQKSTGTSGANTYNFEAGKAKTIWDAGGTDTIDGSDKTLDMNLDLRGGVDGKDNVHFSYTGLRSIQPENHYYHKLSAVPNSGYIAIGYQDLTKNDNPVHIEEARGGSGDDVLIAYDKVAADAQGSVLKGNGGNDTLIGGAGVNILDGGAGIDFIHADQNDVVQGGDGTDVIAAYSGVKQQDGSVIASTTAQTQLYGGADTDHFGVFGKATIKDIERNDYVYIDNIQVTGGIKPLGIDVPIATNDKTGHVFQVAGGDILQENGATLNVKFLWDNDAIATIENYTRPYLQQGDGHIEIYQIGHGSSTPLADWIKAYNAAYNNTTTSTNTTTTAGGSSAAAPAGADTNSANASATVYKPTVGTMELHASIDAAFDGFSGSSASAALTKWQQYLPTLVGLKYYVLHFLTMQKRHNSHVLMKSLCVLT